MTKEELEKEAEDFAIKSYGNDAFTQANMPHMIEPVRLNLKIGYLAGAEPREKRVAELEAQIEKMQNCRNCKKEKIEGACGHFTQVGWCKNWELAD